MDSPPKLFMQYLAHIEHFSFNVWKLLLFALILNFWIQTGLNHREVYNSKSGDVASLAEFYCSLIIRASQFSSTTRNLVPRFKRGVRGEVLVILMDLLEEVNPFRWCLQFFIPMHHDEVVVLSSGNSIVLTNR